MWNISISFYILERNLVILLKLLIYIEYIQLLLEVVSQNKIFTLNIFIFIIKTQPLESLTNVTPQLSFVPEIRHPRAI
jgi:hypothetical protein